MSATTSLSVRVRRLLGRGGRAESDRLAELEGRLARIDERLDGLDAAVGQLHRTVVDADPQLMREVIEAVREDVQALTTQVDEQLVRVASAQR